MVLLYCLNVSSATVNKAVCWYFLHSTEVPGYRTVSSSTNLLLHECKIELTVVCKTFLQTTKRWHGQFMLSKLRLHILIFLFGKKYLKYLKTVVNLSHM